MAGTKRSGRRKTPVALKIAQGTYNADRDGPLPTAITIGPPPKKPRGLAKHASKQWDAVVPGLIADGVVTERDTDCLRSMCELWNLYRVSHDLAIKDPEDKGLRSNIVAYWGRWETAASRFGMNPSDRARLQVHEKPKRAVASRKRG